jgi:hypothetical protein
MTTLRKNKKETVRLPAIYLWAAGQKALLDERPDDFKRIQKNFIESTKYCESQDFRRADREKSIRRAIRSQVGKGIIPLERSAIDLELAVVLFGLTGEFKVFSDRSVVPSGFLRFRKTDLLYIDTVESIVREDSIYPELLNHQDKQSIIDFFDGLASKDAWFKTVNDGSKILRISGEFEIFSSLPKTSECLISLWNAPAKDEQSNYLSNGTFNRKLGKGFLSLKNKNEVVLIVESAQTQLELTAASFVGQWLLIESKSLKVFGQLPDLTEDSDKKKIAIDPLHLLKKFTLNLSPIVYLEKDEARLLADLHSWCVSDDTQTWLKALTK